MSIASELPGGAYDFIATLKSFQIRMLRRAGLMADEFDALRTSLKQQFSIPVQRALSARTISREPIGIARLITPPVRSQLIPPEESYAIHVYMSSHGAVDACINGKYVRVPAGKTADIAIADFEIPQRGHFHTAMDVLHIRFPKRTLADLAYDRGVRNGRWLQTILGGVHDPVLYGLACALSEKINDYGSEDQLFVDNVALAFYAHTVRAYGDGVQTDATRGVLAPWQLRRSCDIMATNLNGNITLVELASACGRAVSHFSRAFRRTIGIPPHQWLMKHRVNKAKDLLKNSNCSVLEVALTCGFADQSHFNRVFYKFEKFPPARWRRIESE